MNKLKISGLITLMAGSLTNEEWLLILSILITVLGMIQDYLKGREN